MNYTTYKYIYPPRPDHKIEPKLLGIYDTGEFYAQPKLNGSCCVVFLDGQNPAIVMNRHNEPMTLVKRDQIDFEPLHRGNGYMVLTGELLNKAKMGESGELFNQKFIIWDILVYEGIHLLDTTFHERQQLLFNIFRPYRGKQRFLLAVSIKGVYMADLFKSDFVKTFAALIKTDMYEGMVIKKKDAKLTHGFHENNNTGWQVKCRKPHKNYKF
jgi:hypothetical protein